MSDVHHYFSKLKRAVIGVAGGLLLSACSGIDSNMLALSPNASPAKEPLVMPVAGKPSAISKFLTTGQTGVKNKTSHTSAVRKVEIRPAATPKSQWCRYLDNDAAARATMLRAPTVSGDINDDGRKSASMSYDVMDIRRAQLIESTAEAKCRRYLANSALNQIVVVAPNDLTRAGFAAKARIVSNRTSKLRAIKTLVRRELKTGNLDRSQATTLTLAVDKVLADGSKASSEAAKRQGNVAYDIKNVRHLAAQLFKAERDLADINSNIRSAEAVSVNLEGGWREGFVQNGIRVQNSSMFGGVKVSVKLGAFNPARKTYETIANRARIKALGSEPGSIFWKIDQLIAAHQRGRNGLISSRNQLIGARANAGRLKANLPAGDPTYLARRYKTEIQIIKLDSEIAGVKASIRQLDANLRKLRQLKV